MTEQDKIKFKQDYFEAEGIRLENSEKNKGMRAIAKIMLNSLWGKLAQRENMTKTEYILLKIIEGPMLSVIILMLFA